MKKWVVGVVAASLLTPLLLLGVAGAMLVVIMAAAADASGCVPGTPPDTGATPGQGVLNKRQMQALILKYFPAREVGRAMAISKCESGWKVDNNNAGMNPDGTTDWGLFQLNDGGTLQGALDAIGVHYDSVEQAQQKALDPAINVRAAAAIFAERGWSPWVCAAPADHGATLTGVVAGLYSTGHGPNWDRYDQWGTLTNHAVTLPASLRGSTGGGPDTPTPDAPATAAAPIRSVVVYGDSLFTPMNQDLPDEISGVRVKVEAETGRHTSEGVTWLKHLDAMPGLIVVSLGANDDAATFAHDAAAFVDAAGDTPILWGDLHGDRYRQHNRVLHQLTLAHGNVHVLPLAASAERYVTGDGVHLTAEGYRKRAALVRRAITTQVQDRSPTPTPAGETVTGCGTPSTDCPTSNIIDNEDHLQPNADAVARCAASMWPQVKEIGGWRPVDPYPYHPSGQAVDIMIAPHNTCSTGDELALGNEIAEFFMKNWNVFRIRSVIWQQKVWSTTGKGDPPDVDATVPATPEGMRDMEDRGSCDANHRDHVHVDTYEPDLFGETPPNFTGIAAADGGFGDAPTRSGGGVMPVLPTVSRDYRTERNNPYLQLKAAGRDGGDPGPGYSNWRGRCHAGWDISNAMGDPVRAPMDGVVHVDGGDYHVIHMDHAGGITSRYLHLSRYAPGIDGKTVTAGTVIGYVGGAGPNGPNSYAPHLHLETYLHGTLVDPRYFLFPDAPYLDAHTLDC